MVESPQPRLKSLRNNERAFVGRGFSHDIEVGKSKRL